MSARLNVEDDIRHVWHCKNLFPKIFENFDAIQLGANIYAMATSSFLPMLCNWAGALSQVTLDSSRLRLLLRRATSGIFTNGS
jgi:hypothetical protein